MIEISLFRVVEARQRDPVGLYRIPLYPNPAKSLWAYELHISTDKKLLIVSQWKLHSLLRSCFWKTSDNMKFISIMVCELWQKMYAKTSCGDISKLCFFRQILYLLFWIPIDSWDFYMERYFILSSNHNHHGKIIPQKYVCQILLRKKELTCFRK